MNKCVDELSGPSRAVRLSDSVNLTFLTSEGDFSARGIYLPVRLEKEPVRKRAPATLALGRVLGNEDLTLRPGVREVT